ncbi:hypothetical protein JRQ81_002235 [Phrynocephalus forsythii]|uniref:Uncharacterized protein n=1 Tax=Phrynocephalus forsythii TaxID=171643 RepID=A0A9Q0XJR0_9SAUR|nr:hypothetical protein JRQ81_002235 [Phrynocephalus forsythii]
MPALKNKPLEFYASLPGTHQLALRIRCSGERHLAADTRRLWTSYIAAAAAAAARVVPLPRGHNRSVCAFAPILQPSVSRLSFFSRRASALPDVPFTSAPSLRDQFEMQRGFDFKISKKCARPAKLEDGIRSTIPSLSQKLA